MTETLKQQTAKGVLWSAIERFSVQGLQFILGLILARILMPEDYGLVGMLTIFIALSQSIVDSGFSSALIQKKDRNETDYSTAFFFNIVVGLFLYSVLFFSAPLIADFYDTPELQNLTKVVGINVFISSLAIVQRAKLTIVLDFKTQARASLTSVVIGGIVGISMAYSDFGVWALVAQSLTRNFVNTILLWLLSKWVPTKGFSTKSFKRLFSFGSKLLGAGLLNTIFNNIYLLVIGKLFNTHDLGYYTRAQQFQKLLSQNIMQIIQRVTFPILSNIQKDEKRLKIAYISYIKTTAYIIFPIMICLGFIAKPLIIILLTEKWLPVVPILQILCIYGMLIPIMMINNNIILVKGFSGLLLKLETIQKALILSSILITFRLGIIPLVTGHVITAILYFFILINYSGKIIYYKLHSQLRDLSKILIISGPMIFLMYVTSNIFQNNIVQLIFSISVSVSTYIITSLLVKNKELILLKKIAYQLIRLKKS